MPKVKSNRVAVYVFRTLPGGTQFLQLHRAAGSGDYAGTWQTVYGGIKSGETAIAAALRELAEETQLVPDRFFQVEYLESFYHRARDRVTVLPVFAAQINADAGVVIDEEHDDFRWVNLADVATHFVWRVQRQAIAIIQQDILGASPAKDLLTIEINAKPKANRRSR
jgi:8-oxo-dGTP pyrophosphatase MutT (NUDIX family)